MTARRCVGVDVFSQVVKLISGSALGKALGLVRELMFASYLGATAWADAYRAALAVTISFSHLLTNEALNAAFIPQYAQDRVDSPAAARRLFSGLACLLLASSGVASIGLYFWAADVVKMFYAGFDVVTAQRSVAMLHVLALGIVPYVLSALWIAQETASQRFTLAAVRPLVQNAGVIIALGLAWWGQRPVWVAWGFTATYVAFVITGLVLKASVLRKGWLRRGETSANKQVVHRFWRALRPMLIFSLLIQGNVLIEKAIASLIGTGAVAAIDYARLLPETAHVLLAVPVGLVSLTHLASIDEEQLSGYLSRLCDATLMILVPVSTFLYVAARPVVDLVYLRGAFDVRASVLTSDALRGLAVGVWAVGLGYILLKVLSARLRNREVLRIGALGVLVGVLTSLVLFRWLGIRALGLGWAANGAVTALLCVRALPVGRALAATVTTVAVGAFVHVGLAEGMQTVLPATVLLKVLTQAAVAAVVWGVVLLASPATRPGLLALVRRLGVSSEDPT